MSLERQSKRLVVFHYRRYILYAWAVLYKRYDREDRIVDETISRVVYLPLRHGVSSEKLSSIVNIKNQMLRTLPTFGIDVSS